MLFFYLASSLLADAMLNDVEPQLLDLRLSDANLVVEAEQRNQKNTTQVTGESTTYKAQSIAPAGEVIMAGSIYHPSLLTFDLKAQLGYEWDKIDASGQTNTSASTLLQNYDLRINLLNEKPYTSTLTAGKSTYVREYDFFNNVHGEAQRYGGSSGYNSGPIPFTIEANHSDMTDETSPYSTTSSYDTLSLNAHNRRDDKNYTDFLYGYTRYKREYTGQSVDEGTDHNIQLSDHENWGIDRPTLLDSRLSYHHNNNTAGYLDDPLLSDAIGTSESSDNLDLQEHFEKSYSPSLRSLYDASFDHFASGSYNNDNYRGQAGLEHHLYESLTSRVDIHGGGGWTTGDAAEANNTFYGVGFGEAYTKRIGLWGQLNLGYQGTFDHQNNQMSSGSATVSIFQERHVLSDDTVTFLNLAQVDASTIRVTDSAGIIIYRELLDYEVIPQGAQTEIRRLPGGTIPNGAVVLVDYRAANPPSSSGNTLTDTYYIRLDLFQGLMGVYSRVNETKNYGDLWQTAPDSSDKVVGTDFNWQGIGASAEYEVYDSSLASYRSKRLNQSFSRQLGLIGRVGFNAGETWTYFPDTDQDRTTYQFIARYGVQLTSTLGFSIEGGKRYERGYQDDRDLTTVRSEIDWQIGDLSLKLTYESQGQTTPEETQNQNRFFLRVKRSF